MNPLTDALYSNYLSSGYPVAAQPPIIYIQAPAVRDSATASLPRPVEPLMIELQGDRYIRVSGQSAPEKETEATSRNSREQADSETRASVRVVPPAILVFRDGHREETPDYTITGGTLYTRSDYYGSGSWTRKIDLSSLDMAETMASNQARGVPFRLPAAPNEVMIGP